MGIPTSPQEAAPAYDDVIHIHPVTRFAPSGSSSGYAAVPQDDLEQNIPAHSHSTSPAPAPQEPESLAQTIAGVFRPKPHVHCEACDAQLETRERRAQEKHCCAMTAWVFMVLFLCGMILGIVIANNMSARLRKHGHD